jgi:hypothetical protein
MDLRELFVRSLEFSYFLDLLDEADLGLEEDRSKFTVVDGEEADHGIIRYLDSTGEAVAIKIVRGGDDEEYEVTEYGKDIINKKLVDLFEKSLDM